MNIVMCLRKIGLRLCCFLWEVGICNPDLYPDQYKSTFQGFYRLAKSDLLITVQLLEFSKN